MPLLETMGAQAAGGIFGLMLGDLNDRRQYNQQEKLTNLQISGNKRMLDYQAQKELELWEKTNYSAQMEQLKKAGLNPAMLYGMGGGGGTTTGGSAAGVAGGTAPSGGGEIQAAMGIGLQTAMTKAQTELIQAQTENVKTETEEKRGETEPAKQGLALMATQIQNQKIQKDILEFEKLITSFEKNVAEQGQDWAIRRITAEAKLAEENLEEEQRENRIGNEVREDIVKEIKARAVGAVIQNELQQLAKQQGVKAIQKTDAEIKKIAADIVNATRGLDQEAMKIKIQEELKDLQVGSAVYDRIGKIIGGIKK